MNIFLKGLQLVETGERFQINFEQRTLKIGHQKLIDKGEYDNSLPLYEKNIQLSLLDVIRELYKIYKYSLPSERSDKKRKNYFKALPFEELTDEQLIFATEREVAQYKLEAFILCAILNGDFIWNEETYGKWFYQDPIESDLVILKKWITNN